MVGSRENGRGVVGTRCPDRDDVGRPQRPGRHHRPRPHREYISVYRTTYVTVGTYKRNTHGNVRECPVKESQRIIAGPSAAFLDPLYQPRTAVPVRLVSWRGCNSSPFSILSSDGSPTVLSNPFLTVFRVFTFTWFLLRRCSVPSSFFVENIFKHHFRVQTRGHF